MDRRNLAGMDKLKRSLVSRLVCRFRSRAVVELVNLVLRHQLHVLRRQRPGRLRLFALDRLLWVLLYRLWPRCLEAMVLVKPSTVIQWHRRGFRLFWRWRSRSGRPSVEREISDLIRQMSSANPLWGAPRIHGELLKLSISSVAQQGLEQEPNARARFSQIERELENLMFRTLAIWAAL